MTAKNQIRLDYADNPDLKELFANKDIGEKCRFTTTMQLNSKDETGADGTVLEIEALPHEDSEDETDTDDSTQSDEPVAILMGGGKSKSKSESY